MSRYGLLAYAGSLDQIGPITRDIEDAALLLNVISGHDPRDSSSVRQEQTDYTAFLQEDLSGMRIALPKEYYELDYNPEVKESVLAAVKKMEAEGAIVEEVSLPSIEYSVAIYYILATGRPVQAWPAMTGFVMATAAKAANVTEMFRIPAVRPLEKVRRILLGPMF